MKTIVFVSEKGGVGKTRLADELYYFYQRTGVPVSLYSFDGQYKNRTSDKKSDNPDVAVVDTPGRLMDDKTVQTLQGADLVVIPTRPTAGNIEAFTRTVALVKANVSCPSCSELREPLLGYPFIHGMAGWLHEEIRIGFSDDDTAIRGDGTGRSL